VRSTAAVSLARAGGPLSSAGLLMSLLREQQRPGKDQASLVAQRTQHTLGRGYFWQTH